MRWTIVENNSKSEKMEKWKSRKEVKLMLKEEQSPYISKIPFYFFSCILPPCGVKSQNTTRKIE